MLKFTSKLLDSVQSIIEDFPQNFVYPDPAITSIFYAVIVSHYWGLVTYSMEHNSDFQDRKSPNIVPPLVMKPIFFHGH